MTEKENQYYLNKRMNFSINQFNRLLYHLINVRNDVFPPMIKCKPCTILCFHGIDELGNTRINSRFISAAKFDKFISLLKGFGQFISISNVFSQNYSTSVPAFCLTFDDGYQCILTHLLPFLQKHSIPASVYISPTIAIGLDMLWPDLLDLGSYLNHNSFNIDNEVFYWSGKKGYKSQSSGLYLKQLLIGKNWNYIQKLYDLIPGRNKIRAREDLAIYWKLLNSDEIRTLSLSPLITIGSHGLTHINLATLPHENAMFELEKSKFFLENCIQKTVNELAYPFGYYTTYLLEDAFKLGFHKQLVTDASPADLSPYPFCLPRFVTNPHISNLNVLYWMTKGRYSV